VGLITGGAGLLALGAGAGVGVYAQDKNEQSSDRCTVEVCSIEDQEAAVALAEDAQGAATAANILYVVGGAAVLTGAVIYFSAPAAVQERVGSLRLTPIVGPGGVAFHLGGHF
jgi:hypothetical protein